MTDLAIIVPSRHRPASIGALLKSFGDTHTTSDLIVVLDDDDEYFQDYLNLDFRANDQLMVIPRVGKGMARPLNIAADLLKDSYRHFAFMGDDHRPRTLNWDRKFIEALDGVDAGIVYGDDLLQGANLATACAMSGAIVRQLGGMVPPGMIHMYLDNFWMKLGNDLGALIYLPDVILEHLHPVAGKAEMDELYATVNNDEVMNADRLAFESYIASEGYCELLGALK